MTRWDVILSPLIDAWRAADTKARETHAPADEAIATRLLYAVREARQAAEQKS